MLRSAILDLMDWRRQLMTGTFTLDHLRDLRLRITSHIDWGNRYVSFPFFLQKKNTIFQGTLKEKQNVKKKLKRNISDSDETVWVFRTGVRYGRI